jgi:hypothetical protein
MARPEAPADNQRVNPAPDYFFFFGFLTSFLGLLSLAIDPPL